MNWEQIIGQNQIKEQLKDSIKHGRVSHAQLFSGSEGSGSLALAIAYANELLRLNNNVNERKLTSLQHPDLHFSFPVSTTDSIKKEPTSKQFINDWRAFISKTPYGNLYDWLEFLGIEKKQGLINVHESEEIIKSLSLSSYEGGYKVLIQWLPESMNQAAANKLLKITEEPPKKTVFLFVSEQSEKLLDTIISRCQKVQIPNLTLDEIEKALIENYSLNDIEAKKNAHLSQGNFRIALQLLSNQENIFENHFIEWVRNAFMAKTRPAVLKYLVQWANKISAWSREEQKQFLLFCTEVFRQALLQTYGAKELVYTQIKSDGFNWDKFSPFIHGANIEDILNELNTATYHIERNANAKIVFLDLSIQLTRFLHRKSI